MQNKLENLKGTQMWKICPFVVTDSHFSKREKSSHYKPWDCACPGCLAQVNPERCCGLCKGVSAAPGAPVLARGSWLDMCQL